MTTSTQTFRNNANNQAPRANVAIFALNTNLEPAEELERAKILLGNQPVKQLRACYKGVQALNYLAPCATDKDIQEVIALARLHKQESVLLVNSERFAALHFLNLSSNQFLGRLTSVSAAEALSSDAWTLDGSQFYVIQ